MSGIGVTSLLIYIPIYLLFLPKGIHEASLSTIVLQGFYQGIIAALVAGFCYTFATLVLGSGAASLTLAIVPGTSALLAVPFLNEAITWTTGAGVLLVSIGALLGVRAKKEKG
jgi:drug/metabolite transporter (DMT)-like permease